MFVRAAQGHLSRLAAGFPVVVVTGPRQSGKTTLARTSFPQHAYVSLEDPDTRERVAADPRCDPRVGQHGTHATNQPLGVGGAPAGVLGEESQVQSDPHQLSGAGRTAHTDPSSAGAPSTCATSWTTYPALSSALAAASRGVAPAGQRCP